MDDCENCEFLIGPCDGSVFIRTSKNCKVSIISKQLRFRECHDCDIYTYCPSDPVIEASSNIKFGPFNYKFPNAKKLFKKANFNESKKFLKLKFIYMKIITIRFMIFLIIIIMILMKISILV
mgnify:CR=1 FL=1